MSEYRPVELLKSAKDLCNFDAICVGGPIDGEFRSLGSLPVAKLTEVVDSYSKIPVGAVRSFSYQLGSHVKYRLSLVWRGLTYLAWLHDSVPCAANSALTAAFDAALEKSKLVAVDKAHALEQAPFKHGDFVVPNGGHVGDGLTVHSCFHRDGKWWFIPSHGNAVARDCNCWVKFDMHAVTKAMDEENENAAPHATPDPKHKVLSDAEMFGPTQLFQTTNNNGENVTYGIDWSKLDLMSYASKPKSGPEYAASFLTNRTVAPFRVGQMVRWKSKGTAHIVEAIKYVESEKCWAIRIPGHDRPYNASMFEASGQVTAEVNVAPPPDPQPLGRRPRRNIIRKERPHD